MNGPWRDPDTGTVVEFASAYQGESTFSFRGGVIGDYPESRRFRLIAPDWRPEEAPTPRLLAYYANEDAPTGEHLAVWERYCAAARAEHAQWMADRGYTTTDPAP